MASGHASPIANGDLNIQLYACYVDHEHATQDFSLGMKHQGWLENVVYIL